LIEIECLLFQMLYALHFPMFYIWEQVIASSWDVMSSILVTVFIPFQQYACKNNLDIPVIPDTILYKGQPKPHLFLNWTILLFLISCTFKLLIAMLCFLFHVLLIHWLRLNVSYFMNCSVIDRDLLFLISCTFKLLIDTDTLSVSIINLKVHEIRYTLCQSMN
jgi:hypothetical protein